MRIDEMQAGREMDALIAEKVMGYVLSALSLPAYPKYKLCDVASGKFTGYAKNVPNYSTDIAAAWEVVEKISEKHFINILTADKWGVEIGDYYTRGAVRWFVNAPTAPLAICRAALKAVTGREEL